MVGFINKRSQALETCDKVINGIEDGTISISSALLQCLKIARLVNDVDSMEWLNYELNGYARNDNGYLTEDAWKVASKHGRKYIDYKEKKEYVFTDLVAEIENYINNSQKALNNFSTQGFSVSGEQAFASTNRMTANVTQATNNLLQTSKLFEQRLAILKGQFYNYAIKWQIDLRFGNISKKVFDEYQEKASILFSDLSTTTLQKLSAIEDLMEDGNPERYSQVLTSCRRLWEDVAKHLFSIALPAYSEKTYRTLSGKEIDISDNHYNNQLSAAIETLQKNLQENPWLEAVLYTLLIG